MKLITLSSNSSDKGEPFVSHVKAVKAHGNNGICSKDVWNHPAQNCSAPVQVEQNACSSVRCKDLCHMAMALVRWSQLETAVHHD